MGYFDKETETKILKCIDKIESISSNKLNSTQKQDIYNVIENFAKWLHKETCYRMIDPD